MTFFSIRGRGLLGLLFLAASGAANALPSFARQTGEECAACHVGSIGPQLTPHGQKFKMGGYVDGNGKDDWWTPFAGQAIATYTHTSKDQPGDAADTFDDNDNLAFQEGSLFFAGRYFGNVGGFVQETYSGVDHQWAWDNVDLRLARTIDLGGRDAILGLSFNNSPTTQDPFNTLPAWGFPYVSSDLTPGYLGEPMLAGGVEQMVAGLTGYGFFYDWLYVEGGAYHDLGSRFLHRVGVPGEDRVDLSGLSPYFRVAATREFNHQSASVGLVAFDTDVRPDPAVDAKDKYRDWGLDASWQYLGTRRDQFAVNARWIHEKQKLDATFDAASAERSKHHLDEFDVNGSYYFENTWGGTVGWFSTQGSRDATLYGAEELEGSRTGKPDTDGFIFQADWTPFGKEDSWMAPNANLRLALQYTAYNKFNGAKNDYDGEGRDASDNNTLMLFAWFAF